jgi:hypothetical protein
MEAERFDSWTKGLATRANRRTVLRGITAATLGALGLRAQETAAQPQTVTICHWDDESGIYQQLTIPEAALGGHGRHAGDVLNPDFTSDAHCGSCGNTCTGGATCGGGGTPGVCGTAAACDPFLTRDGNGDCVNPCSLGTCVTCASRLCGANPDGSAFCADGYWEWTCESQCDTELHIYDVTGGTVNYDICRDGYGACIQVEGPRSVCSTT